MTKTIASVLSFIVFLFALSTFANAEEEYRKLVVDTKVKGFTQSEWKDSLESSQIIFAPGDKFQLRTIIANQGNRNQTNLRVKILTSPSVTIDSPSTYTIPEIGANSEYSRIFTVTVKDKQYVNKALTAATVRFDVESEIGTKAGDFSNFFTSNGTKEATSSAKTLPATGAATLLLMGTISALGLSTFALALRKVSRGY
jgi:hypothetical protein